MDFNAFLDNYNLKIFSKLTKRSGQNVTFDNLSKSKMKIIVLMPIDGVFISNPQIIDNIIKLNNNTLKELINLHVIQKMQIVGNTTILTNVLGNQYQLKDNKINGIPIISQALQFGNTKIIPITQLIVNDKLRRLLTKSTTTTITKQEQDQINLFLTLPSRLLYQMASGIDGSSLLNLCQVSKELNNRLCGNDNFWKDKVRYDFPDKSNIKFKPEDLSWKEYYKSLIGFDLYAFGLNNHGQLGLGDNIDINTPTLVKLEFKVKEVVCGGYHTMIISGDGNLYAFGDNDYGQLGLGHTGGNINMPTLVNLDFKVKMVACGGYHTMIISDDGNLYAFGRNNYGQLGLGDNQERNIPTLVNIDFKVKQVACGNSHTTIISEDNNLYTFGYNRYGQLGLGDNRNKNIPTLVNLDFKVKMIDCGSWYTMIISEDNNLYGFGHNEYGQLGLGDNNRRNMPTLVNLDFKVKEVACGIHHTMIISEDDNLYGFGNNGLGQLGLGNNKNRNIPTLVNLDFKVKMVSCGDSHTTIISEDDNLYTFGYNRYGQLGLGDNRDRNIPTLVNLDFKVKRVACGYRHTMILI